MSSLWAKSISSGIPKRLRNQTLLVSGVCYRLIQRDKNDMIFHKAKHGWKIIFISVMLASVRNFHLVSGLCTLSLQTVQNCVHVQNVFTPLCLSNVFTYENRLLPDLYAILLKTITNFIISNIFQCQSKLLLIIGPSFWWLSPEVYLCAGNSDIRAHSLGNWGRKILNNDLGPELQK